jgi:hypothetical protein
MIKRISILVLFFLLHPSAIVFASSLNDTRVNISLLNAEGQPLPNVQISMDLSLYEVLATEQLEVRGAFSDECSTDGHGVCSILIGETGELLLRGSLDLGEYGSRNLEWHGGALDVPIQIEQAAPVENCSSLRTMIYSVILFLSTLLGMVVQHKRVQV